MRHCKAYRDLGTSFSAASIDDTDFAEFLPRLGFDATRTEIRTADTPEFAGHSFGAVCIVWVERG